MKDGDLRMQKEDEKGRGIALIWNGFWTPWPAPPVLLHVDQ